MKMDCPIMKAQGIENAQAQEITPNHHDPKKNPFDALCSRIDQEEPPDRRHRYVTSVLY